MPMNPSSRPFPCPVRVLSWALGWALLGAGWGVAGALPFDPLPPGTSAGSPRRLVAHHHNFTYKQDNLDGSDPNEWWNRALTDGFSLIGGIPCDGGGVRSRPYPLPPMDPATYAVDRWKPEFNYCKDAGVDLVFINMQPVSGSGGTRQERLLEALEAAQQLGGIEVAINFDLTGAVPAITPEDAAAWAAANAFGKPAYAHAADGRAYIGAFLASADAAERTWFKGFIRACESRGTPAAFVPTSNYNRTQTRGDFADLGVANFPGYGGWGNSRSPSANATGEADEAAQTGRFYVWPVRPGDFRIKGGSYLWDEPAGPQQFINAWSRAVAYKTPADPLWVQLITGSDQFEGTAVWPTTGANFLWMDLTCWFHQALKTGSFPQIRRDGVFYCHRVHHHTLRGTRDRSSWSYPHNNVVAESQIHAVVFAREPATLEIAFAGETHSFPVPGGVMTVVSRPFLPGQTGTPRFRLVRADRVAVDIYSLFPIVDGIEFTDPEYKGGSSLRPGTFAPPPALLWSGRTGGATTFTVRGPKGPDYTIQGSSELQTWSDLFRVPSAEPPFLWSHPDPAGAGPQFFRVVISP